MTLLEKIIYVSDYIEPSRNQAPNLEYIRKLSFNDLDRAVYEILKDTLEYLKENNQVIDTSSNDICYFEYVLISVYNICTPIQSYFVRLHAGMFPVGPYFCMVWQPGTKAIGPI